MTGFQACDVGKNAWRIMEELVTQICNLSYIFKIFDVLKKISL